MKNSKFSIKTIVAVGIGAAVFMILGRFGSIPTGIPNTNIETAYAYLALMAILYGSKAGFLIGLIGHGLKDLVFYGMPWFSWVISSAVVGLVIGIMWKKIKVDQGEFGKKEIIVFNITQIFANVLAWFVLILSTYSKTKIKSGSLKIDGQDIIEKIYLNYLKL